MRHDTRAALRKLREDIEAKARALDGMPGWSLSAGRIADEHRVLSSKIAKVLEDDARADEIERTIREDRQDSKT